MTPLLRTRDAEKRSRLREPTAQPVELDEQEFAGEAAVHTLQCTSSIFCQVKPSHGKG